MYDLTADSFDLVASNAELVTAAAEVPPADEEDNAEIDSKRFRLLLPAPPQNRTEPRPKAVSSKLGEAAVTPSAKFVQQSAKRSNPGPSLGNSALGAGLGALLTGGIGLWFYKHW